MGAIRSVKSVLSLEDLGVCLKKEVVRTLPFTPDHAEVYLSFGGAPPIIEDESYASWAKVNDVRPVHEEVHIGSNGASLFYSPLRQINQSNDSLLDVIGEARKPHTIRVIGCGEAFDSFRRKNLSSLVEEYEVLDAQFQGRIESRGRDEGVLVSLGRSTYAPPDTSSGSRTVIGGELGVYSTRPLGSQSADNAVASWTRRLAETYDSASLAR